MSKLNFSMGGDPEVMVINKKTKSPVPSWVFTKGDKKNPAMFAPNLYAHVDNVALELTFTPASSYDRFITVASTILPSLHKFLGSAYSIRLVPFTDDFDAATLEHPFASEFGCNPDFSAYTDPANGPREAVDVTKVGNTRFFGGHIHFGYNQKLSECPPFAMARFIDALITVPLIAHGKDRQGKRREVYGLAGLHRPKPYGVEYRTLSNFWLQDKVSTGFIARQYAYITRMVTSYRSTSSDLYHLIDWAKVQKVINQELEKEARELFLETSEMATNVGLVFENGTALLKTEESQE